MKIPDEAVDASTAAIRDDLMRIHPRSRPLVLAMLARSTEAAAPIIAAHTLRAEVPLMHDWHDAAWLESRAIELDPQGTP